MIRIVRATSLLAGRQASWISGMEPWLGLGYQPSALERFLRRAAREGEVFVALVPAPPPGRPGRSGGPRGVAIAGIAVVQPRVLLGDFLALLAVRPQARRSGVGRALVAFLEARILARRRWFFVSADAANRAALRFYAALGFARVGRLPDLVADGHTEVLLRKGRPPV
jgi:ribosomal protein S18 acetylase RimI-like enzyme